MQVNNSALLIKVDTNEYPVTISQFRNLHKNWLFGEQIDEDLIRYHGYEVVRDTNRPSGDVVEELAPILVEGNYYRRYRARNYNQQELDAAIAQKKTQSLSTLKEIANEVCNRGTPYDFGGTVGIQHIQLHQEDIANLTGLSQKADRNPEKNDHVFCTYENTVVENLSSTDIIAITDKAHDAFVNSKKVAWGIRTMIETATTLEGIPDDESIREAVEASIL